jgi:hypothetical protein
MIITFGHAVWAFTGVLIEAHQLDIGMGDDSGTIGWGIACSKYVFDF